MVSGGRLITTLSANNVGPADYTSKVNWRRRKDAEIRREGYLDFSPLSAIADQQVFDAADTCIRVAELVRGDGTKTVIGFSRTKIKQFNTTTGAWDTLGSGYSSSGKRWQVVTIGGVLVANNAVDLPIYFQVGDAAVTAMKELREVGIARVGRIIENNGFLVIADITEIYAEVLPLFMRGWSVFTVSATQAKASDFAIVNGDNQNQFNVTTGASNIVATLPATPPTDFYVWLKKADTGAGTVTTSPAIAVSPVSLSTQNDLALVFWDATNGAWVSVTFPLGVVPADDPYGTPPTYITRRLPWSVANSEYGEPQNWAPAYEVLMPSASATITLPFPSSVFVAGQTRVAVVNGGPLGGPLGGQEATPNGVLVTAVSGRTLTLEVATDSGLTYPRVVTVLRWEDTSSLVGRYDLQGDNSEITSMASLRNWIVLFRTTGIYRGRYTGDPNAPFVFEPIYSGSNVPLWPDAIANIKGDYLLYPAKGNRIYAYDGVSWPEVHELVDAASSLFFDNTDQATEVFAIENSITKEWWFLYPDQTVCVDFDTEGLSVSVIDQAFDAAAVIHKPLSSDVWFVMAIANEIKLNGLVFGETPVATWLRDGVAAQSTLLFGLNSFGDESNEKLLQSLTPILGSLSISVALEIQVYSYWNPNAAPTTLLVPAEALPTPSGRNYVPMIFQALYLQDKITLTDTRDVDARYVKRIWEVDLVKASGITRSVE